MRKFAHGDQTVSYRLPSYAEPRNVYTTPGFRMPYGTVTLASLPEGTYGETSTPFDPDPSRSTGAFGVPSAFVVYTWNVSFTVSPSASVTLFFRTTSGETTVQTLPDLVNRGPADGV